MINLLENLLVMVLSVVVLVGGFFVILVLVDWCLKFKSGSREQEGLTNLWLAAKKNRTTTSPPPELPNNEALSADGLSAAPDGNDTGI